MLLLFAEDERYTRQGILESVDWQELGVDCVKTASDGKQGQEMLSLHPDILLTDIRMPYCSGLELAALAKEGDPDCEIIILSGYSDKEYLFRAISLSTVAYIEKPVDINQLSDAISKAVKRRLRHQHFHELETDSQIPVVLDYLPDPNDPNYSHITRLVLDYLARNLYKPDLSLDSIAAHVHVCASYLSDSFKKGTGHNLKRLITEIRMKEACSLLHTTNLSVAHISAQIGYRNANYFSKLFRKEIGMSPHEFRFGGKAREES